MMQCDSRFEQWKYRSRRKGVRRRLNRFLAGLFTCSVVIGCSGLVSLKLPPQTEETGNISWTMLGGNLAHQHYSVKNIAPPFAVVWEKRVKSVVTDHPLALGDYIFAPTQSGMLYTVDYQTGQGVGSGKLGPAVEHSPSIHESNIYAGLVLGKKTLVGYSLRDASPNLAEAYPHISTSPIIWDNKIYFGTEGSKFFCVNLHSGNKIWDYKTDAPIRSSPALHEQWVIFGDDGGTVHAVDAETGTKLWATELKSHIFSHPVLDDSVAYVGTVAGKMYALNIENGDIIWVHSFDGAIYSSPSLFKNILYLGNNNHEVVALHKSTGELIWKFKTEGIVNTVPLASPDYVYVTSWDRNLYVLNRFTGQLVYQYTLKKPAKSSPIIYRDYLLVQTANDDLIALANEKFVENRSPAK